MEDWVQECLRRRKNGDKVEVSGFKGQVFQLGGQQFQPRHFFGLCPGCLKIGEHSACSGKGMSAIKIHYLTLYRMPYDLLLLQRLSEEGLEEPQDLV